VEWPWVFMGRHEEVRDPGALYGHFVCLTKRADCGTHCIHAPLQITLNVMVDFH
jgi:hypothetical protein